MDFGAAGEKVNILVVDDRPENVLAMKAILSNTDYNVVTASNGSEALRKILKFDFAVVLLDVLMPSMDGFETARLIFEREASRNTPIIFLTAAGSDVGSMHQGYSVGAVDYLIKPVDAQIVRAKVGVFVDLFRKSKQIRRQEEKLREVERLRSQQALVEREAEYEATFDKAAVGIAHVGLDGRCLRINQKFCDILGCSRKEALNLRLEDVAHVEDVARQAEGLARLLSGTLLSFRSEERFMHRSGRILRVDLTVSLLRDAAGEPKKFITIVEDATERKRAEEGQSVLAQASKILLNSLEVKPTLALVAQCVVPVLADLCLVEVLESRSAAPAEVCVGHADPTTARQFEQLVRRHSNSANWGALRALATGQPELISDVTPAALEATAGDSEDLAQLRKLGIRSVITVPLRVRSELLGAITLISTVPGRRYSVADVGIAEDLAHRTALGIENARLYREAHEAVAARDEFLSIASHELRTPLTPLQIQLQRMLGVRGKAGVEEMPREQLRAIVQRSSVQVGRLTALVDSLLDVSRITSGRFALQPEEIDLCELAREIGARFSEAAANAGCKLLVHASGALISRCDPMRVEQVLNNLLGNAIKYGAGKPIEVKVTREADNALLIVSDRGIGISPTKLPTIFERFERGDAAASYGGLGLGLYIARQIVDAHGGLIRVDSTEGRGSVFTVQIPLAPRPAAVQNAAELSST
jgi:PAS domain S-box-containing protein